MCFASSRLHDNRFQVRRNRDVPVAYGVITADTIAQAEVRAGVKTTGKGWEAAMAAIEMANLFAHASES